MRIGLNQEAAKLIREKVLELLERKNMSILSLSKETGVPSTSLHDILIIGKRVGRGSIGYIEAIFEYFDKDLENTLKNTQKDTKAKILYSQLEDSQFQKLLGEFRTLKILVEK